MLAFAALPAVAQQAGRVDLEGVNLAGAEFGSGALPGQPGLDYVWPTGAELGYFHAHGMNVVRIPFLWERLQPTPNATFDPAYRDALRDVVSTASALGVYVILDPHNYARYYGQVIGSSAVPMADFADFWSRLAGTFQHNPHVIFGLMNEPHGMATTDWLVAANAAIAAIRNAGANQLILVPGNGWTGAHSWSDTWYGASNASVMGGIVDPANHFAYELHQYLDADSSGTRSTCTQDATALHGVTQWLQNHQAHGFLAEFAGADNAACQAGVNDLLDYMASHSDTWIGWTWWAAGPWWNDYMFSIEPRKNGSDAPQMAWLQPWLPGGLIFRDGFDRN